MYWSIRQCPPEMSGPEMSGVARSAIRGEKVL